MRAGIIQDEHVVLLCRDVEPGSSPTTIPCRPLHAENINDCFEIVSKHISQQGGSEVIGWAIWEWPSVMVEAEFHSVWKSPEGELICLAPRPIPFDEITFLPSAAARYEGRQVDNVRHPLSKDNDIVRFIFLAKQRFALFNRGERAYQHGAILLRESEVKELNRIEKEMHALHKRLSRRCKASDF
ncbi:zinc chelation protein SecC [Lysobacter sp. Root916]|uniref:zinc chelation protein SecC n=1 Tax=Lysobacter sp. Root916 TaxID=1736606 RepID=UPI0012FA1800|nr:zinc chelation protein SecC [Lysobacter sp. Root916]